MAALAAGRVADPPAVVHAHDPEQRRDREHGHAEQRVDGQADDEHAHERQDGLGHRPEVVGEQLADLVGVAGQARDEVALLAAVVVGQRQALEVVVHLQAKLVGDPLAGALEPQVAGVAGQRVEHRDADDRRRDEHEQAHVLGGEAERDRVARDHRVDEELQRPRLGQAGDGDEHGGDARAAERRPVAAHDRADEAARPAGAGNGAVDGGGHELRGLSLGCAGDAALDDAARPAIVTDRDGAAGRCGPGPGTSMLRGDAVRADPARPSRRDRRQAAAHAARAPRAAPQRRGAPAGGRAGRRGLRPRARSPVREPGRARRGDGRDRRRADRPSADPRRAPGRDVQGPLGGPAARRRSRRPTPSSTASCAARRRASAFPRASRCASTSGGRAPRWPRSPAGRSRRWSSATTARSAARWPSAIRTAWAPGASSPCPTREVIAFDERWLAGRATEQASRSGLPGPTEPGK